MNLKTTIGLALTLTFVDKFAWEWLHFGTNWLPLSMCGLWTERREAEGLESEFEWLTEMTEDEYNALSPRTRNDIDYVRLQINKERLKKYFLFTHSRFFSVNLSVEHVKF